MQLFTTHTHTQKPSERFQSVWRAYHHESGFEEISSASARNFSTALGATIWKSTCKVVSPVLHTIVIIIILSGPRSPDSSTAYFHAPSGETASQFAPGRGPRGLNLPCTSPEGAPTTPTPRHIGRGRYFKYCPGIFIDLMCMAHWVMGGFNGRRNIGHHISVCRYLLCSHGFWNVAMWLRWFKNKICSFNVTLKLGFLVTVW